MVWSQVVSVRLFRSGKYILHIMGKYLKVYLLHNSHAFQHSRAVWEILCPIHYQLPQFRRKSQSRKSGYQLLIITFPMLAIS